MNDHVCPWWIGYLLASPVRALLQDPRAIVGPHVRPGVTVLDVGCAMGFFSLPMARAVGPGGRVVCVDVQRRMIDTLRRRARRRGLSERIDARVCRGTDLGIDDLAGAVDFALAFAVVHEVPDVAALMRQLSAVLVPGGVVLLAEPAGHVSSAELDEELRLASLAGLEVTSRPRIRRSSSALLIRA